MLRTPLGVDVPAASGGNFTANLIFATAARAKYMRVDDIVEDRLGELYTVLWWATYPGDFVSGGTVALGGTGLPTQSLTTSDAAVFTSGQLDVRPLISIDGSIGTVTDTGPDDGQNYESLVTASWTSASQGNAATTGDHIIDSTGKAYAISRIDFPGSSQWASGIVVSELEKEGVPPQIGTSYLYSPTRNFSFYQGKVLNDIAEDARRNRDEFTTDAVISGIYIDIDSLSEDLNLVISSGGGNPDLSASGFVTQDDIAASGFVGTHSLLSDEHVDTISQPPESGGIVAALDGAWSQLLPGSDGSVIFVEGGLPAYNSNFRLLPDGSIDVGGNVLISGDLNVLGNLDATPDLTASGFVIGPDGAGDSTVVLFDGTTGELIKELPNDADGLVLTLISGSPAWGPPTSGGGGGDVAGPGSSTDNAIVRWDGSTGTVIQNSNVIISDSGIVNLPAGVAHSVTQASGTATFNVQNSDWLVRVDTQGQAVAVNMPPAPANGQVHTIKDGNGNAANNNITITASPGQLIDPSSTTLVLNLAYQSVELMWVSDPGIWHII